MTSGTQSLSAAAETLSRLVGHEISEVRYLSPSTADAALMSNSQVVDQVSMGVWLRFASGSGLILRWKMNGVSESLTADFVDSEPLWQALGLREFASSSEARWSGLVGSRILAVGMSTHRPDESCPRQLWAVRLSLETHRAVVVALGELSPEGLSYMPDSVVVIFDPTVAAEFKIPAGESEAWGVDVEVVDTER